MEKHLDLSSIVDFKGLKIKLSSPETIKSWSYGEVTKPETINYRTLKPEKDGLFSENIFGPTKDWECYCGKYKRIRYRGIICDKCGVEVTQSKVRRERMGHISLACPVTHVWFFKGAPSKLSLILDVSPRDLESVIYFAKFLVIDQDEDKRKKILGKLSESEKDKRKDLEKKLEEKIREQEKEKNAEIKTVESKIKAKEQKELAIQEVELKYKQKVSVLRDEHALEETRLEEIFKTISDLVKSVRLLSIISEEELLKLDEYEAAGFIRVGMGAEAVLEILKKLDLQKLCADLRNEVHKTSGQRQIKARKRLLILEGLRKAEVKPEWMILQILPVIPPDLRPMVQLSGGRFATSDLNDLYRRVINRNNRLKHLMDLGAPEIILRNEKRMLQEAVDSLIDTPQRLQGRPLAQAQVLRSLSEMLRGKQGRFRQNLLGKRVDYSGRSVIVVGPELKLNECGLPKEMALEMFKPFVLRELIIRGLAPNVKNAKRVLEKKPPEIFDILEDITKNHPVLLNRAPTLHRLGIQAFFPILTEGNAIRIHPAICAGFNADFDGDQMAIHVPLSKSSQEEAIHLMMPNTNLLRPADGTPITIPNKEMALGCYFFTYMDDKAETFKTVFTNSDEAIYLYQIKKLSLHQKIHVKIDGEVMETSVGRLIFNEYLPEKLKPVNANVGYKAIKSIITKTLNLYPNEVVTKLIDDLENLGFLGSTLSGSSFSVSDCTIIPQKDEIISEADTKVAEIERNAKRGLITYEEMRHLEDQVWIETTDKLADLTWASFDKDNPIRTIVASEASRASKDQVKQLSAMRGLNLDPVGRTIRLPTKSNFREGLSVFEYLSVTRGSRKGLTDTALRTADAGYLTRRLIDVAHDAIMRSEDCNSTEGIEIERHDPVRPEGAFVNRISGRITAKKITDPTDGRKILLKEGEEITEEKASLIDKAGVEKVIVRSPLTCQAKYGMCIKCYGRDLGTRKEVEIGTPVGIIAAQSIGEPGTQLTMRTKHTGGIMAVDVTQGLPRVEELFEVRTPKVLSPIAEIAGKIEIVETPEGYKVRIQSVGIKPVEEREYIIPLTSQLKVKDDELVTVGQQLASGYLDVKEVLAVKGLRGAQRYLIDEIQAVYESQGIPINDKHFEVIVRKMSEKVRIESSGDTNLFPGELIDKSRFEGENAKVIAEGGEPAIAQVVILGVSKASLYTESWLSAASFQETTNVLTEAAIQGKEDKLLGLKENVIIGRLIPTSPERAMMEPD